MVVPMRGGFFELPSPAKINLHLEILAKRTDGFHELETLMVPLSLCDTVSLQPRTDGLLSIDCRWDESLGEDCLSILGSLPSERENIVSKALLALRQSAGCELGADVKINKRIPSQAGLGGASSNAATALRLAAHAWRLDWSAERLAELAGTIGSDVPFFLQHGAAICTGKGERIEPLGPVPPLPVVVVKPPQGLSTPEVYRRCRVPEHPQGSDAIVRSLLGGDREGVAQALHNRLQHPAEEALPMLRELREAIVHESCLGGQLTGSGSCVFGIYRTRAEADAAAERLRSARWGCVFTAWAGSHDEERTAA